MKTGVFYGTERNNAPYNMLINSDLRRPINQRGATYAPAWDYGIDMWREYDGNARADFAFDADGMTLNGVLAQRVPSSAFITGNPYSAVLYMADDTVLVASGAVHIAGSAWTGFASAEKGNVKITLFTDAQDGSYIGVRIGASGEKIRACALYEGEYTADTVPPYVPPDPDLELVKCLRYYRVIEIETDVNGSIRECGVSFDIPMRITPTTIIKTAQYFENGWLDFDHGHMSTTDTTDKMLRIRINELSSVVHVKIALSADL